MPEVTLASNEGLTGPASGETRTLPENRRLGHYQLLDEIGRGGMGVVYAAHDSKLDRKVAIKMLRSEGDAKLQRRLVREAKAMAKLAHPCVVSVHEIGEHEGAAFIVMEYVEGQTLRQWLAAASRSVTEILTVFMAAGRGLAAIHDADLIHRDFKPDNVMIRDTGQVLVMDLGIARAGPSPFAPTETLEGLDDAAVDLTRDGVLMGSPAYMAAEQFDGAEITSKTDQFSFCVSLWEALYGERPFAAETMETLIEAVTAGRMREVKRSDIPGSLQSVLERGLQVEPLSRFESMTALIAALEHAAGSRKRTRIRLAWAAGLAIGLAVTVFGVRASTAPEPNPAAPTQPATQPEVADPKAPRRVTTSGAALEPALSPDGQHMVFVDGDRLAHVDLRSGETKHLSPKVSDVVGLQLSNDGTVMFSARMSDEGGVYRMSSLDSEPALIPNVSHIFCRFPDRDRIVSFHVSDKAVKLSDANGLLIAEIPVPGEYEWLREVACDPRNNRVAVLHRLGATHTLKLIDLDGGPARVLFESSAYLALPHFDKTGDTLYYLATRDEQTNLEATAVGGNDDLPVTRVVLSDIDAEAFSRADSGRLAYARARFVQRGIWRLDATDSSLEDAEQIVKTDAEDVYFDISPDETQLAYSESSRDLGRLILHSLADGSERELTRGQRIRGIVWSPDGQTIAFSAIYRGEAHIWTVPTTGGPPTAFERALVAENAPMAWAPSERILYAQPDFRNFRVLDPNTKDDRPLIADESDGFPFFPAASPDGSVAVLWTRKPLGVWLIDIEKGTSRLLTEGEYYPMRWSKDGRFLYAAGAQTGSATPYHRIPSESSNEGSGPLEPWRTVDLGPRRDATCQVTSTEALLCSVDETVTDIWIAEAIE